ncbi:MAG: DUF554 domain-containing protein [Actinobacteria bacterium]|jgi:uncharacterized membrane protein YqgA involved in biofilm formation|nr:DUF554 domain-containing protein [Actinomycetota bacterium]MBU1492844.1 DUF554 domain-containing protein [Actinomycetota bacterium]
MIGTLTNVGAVLAGSAIGAAAGSRFPDRFRETIMAALGLVTMTIGIRETLASDEFPLVLGAVLLGTVLGEALRIEAGLESFGAMLQRRFTPGDGIHIDVDAPETAVPVRGRAGFAEGFVIASLVFCVGPLLIVGSIEDGLGNPDLLLVKAALDGFASIAFASVYGWGVAASVIPIILLQGGIALGAGALEGVLTEPMLAALGTAGGILLLGIALRLLDLKKVRVANMLPAIVLAPLFVRWWG